MGHTATLIDNKLYILGGSSGEDDVGKDFFYIDFSVPVNTKNIQLNDLSSINTVPSHFGAGSGRGGANNNTLFIGGPVGNLTVDKIELVYAFDLQSNSWSVPKITGEPPFDLFAADSAVIDSNGMMYFWDGIVQNVNIIDTVNLIWKKGSAVGASKGGLGSASTLLPDNKIIYMGGGDNSVLMNQVYIYDTVNNNWSAKTTSGNAPFNRQDFSAVLGLDGQRVIIFGGIDIGGTIDTPKNPLYELNLINFEWNIPNTSGTTPSSRNQHRANVIGNYMVISFGSFFSISGDESDILLLDISNVNEYVWTNDFKPSPSSLVTTSGSVPMKPPPSLSPISGAQQQPENISNITGGVIGFLVGGASLSLIGIFLYKWNKNRNKNETISYNNNQANNIQTGRKDYYPGQELPPPVINKNINESNYYNNQVNNNQAGRDGYHPGQEIVQPPTSVSVIDKRPIANNDEIQELKQEIQNLKEIIIQNNKQATNSMSNN
ncbi:hypothetical protein GLOIN_2v1780026 [Rhizophagus clarus]|uniref:Galactose oxidase n=1 Tax=Rhizophagus clarus TaxID=94130 RepID=A0A8H3M997_9GLOM|nr:hypothetical protein GLOIN_2v1780026 [Rhizophagus clarus]